MLSRSVSLIDLECLDSCLLVLFLDTKPWGKMEAHSSGPSMCVVLDRLNDGGGEEDAVSFTHTCLRGGQRWSIPPWVASAWELCWGIIFLSQKQNTRRTTAAVNRCFKWEISFCVKSQLHNYHTEYLFLSNLCLGFYPGFNMYRVDSERGECRAFTANNILLLLLCNMHALHKLCSATRDIQSTYVTSNNSSPSPCSPGREPVMCEFGCRDGCVLWRQSHLPVSHYRFSFATDAYCYVQLYVS